MTEINFKTLISKLLEFKTGILYAFLLYGVWTIFEIAIPFLTQLIVDEGIFYADKQFIFMIIAAMVMFRIGGMLADFSKNWIMRNIGVRMNMFVIEEYYDRLLQNELTEYNNISEGKVIQNVNDNMRIEKFLTNSMISFVNALFSICIFCSILFYFDSLIGYIFVGFLVAVILWDLFFLKTAAFIDEERYQLSSKVQNEVVQSVKGIFDIKMNELESYQKSLWHKLHQHLSNVRLALLKIFHFNEGGGLIMVEIRNGIILLLACFSIMKGQMSIGTLLAIQYILGRSQQPVTDLLKFIQERQDAILSLRRLQGVFKSRVSEKKQFVQSLKPNVILEDITYFYPSSTKGVKKINISIPYNSKIALIGESGNGKSTLINIILGLFKPSDGRVYMTQNNKEYSISQCSFSALSQDGHIFNETLIFNVTFAQKEEVDMYRFNEVLKLSCLDEVVEDLPNKSDTILGVHGIKLSKGQFQRVLIARALYKKSNIIVLDEPTSALDNKTSKAVMDNILNYCENRTIILATHKLFLATKMDSVIVMDNGKIIKQIDHVVQKELVDINAYLI